MSNSQTRPASPVQRRVTIPIPPPPIIRTTVAIPLPTVLRPPPTVPLPTVTRPPPVNLIPLQAYNDLSQEQLVELIAMWKYPYFYQAPREERWDPVAPTGLPWQPPPVLIPLEHDVGNPYARLSADEERNMARDRAFTIYGTMSREQLIDILEGSFGPVYGNLNYSQLRYIALARRLDPGRFKRDELRRFIINDLYGLPQYPAGYDAATQPNPNPVIAR